MRRPLLLLTALIVFAFAASPVNGASLQRTFRAQMGGGANGTVAVSVFSDGAGKVDYALKGLNRKNTFKVTVYKGRCGNLGSAVAALQAVVTNSSGAVTVTRWPTIAKIQAIWAANWTGPISVKLKSSTQSKCALLAFVHATRVVIPAYSIDLPVVRTPSGYPYCNVAMYQGALSQPMEPGVTFIFAHARKGMFLPLLRQWQLNKGVNLIGKKVDVYTSNNKVSTYQVYQVRLMNSIQGAVSVTAEELWLQTSTGPHGTVAKLVVKAHRIATTSTSYAAAHPTPHIVRCGY